MITYKGYNIRKKSIGYKRHIWEVLTEYHDFGTITQHVTYTGTTLKQCKQAINAHFGRL